jgi:hypothetical protein
VRFAAPKGETLMRIIHRLVIAACTASLVLLGLAGTPARADNMTPVLKPKAGVSRHSTALEQIRERVRHRDLYDGGCG